MMEEKGVWTLVDACRVLKDKGLCFECHFVGKWSDISEESFKNKVCELNLRDSIFAHGAKYGMEKDAFFDKADVFVFPTYYHNECFPLVLLEAMQQGLPCISTTEGGISDIIDDGKTGFLIEKRNSVALAACIELLLCDRTLCRKMGENAKQKFLGQFTLDCFEDKMKGILETLLIK